MKPRNSKLNVIRWIARITGTFLAVSILIFAIFSILDEIKTTHTTYSLLQVLVFLFWGIALLALLVAVWKEGWGGLISLTSLVLMFIFGLFVPEANKTGMLVVIIIMAIPSFLYLYYWWENKKTRLT